MSLQNSDGKQSGIVSKILGISLAVLGFVGVVLFLALVQRYPSSYADLRLTKIPQAFAETRGAYCLDGTPPAYYLREDASVTSWILYMQGGAWCTSLDSCISRRRNERGSSQLAPSTLPVYGILSDDCNTNPDFCRWNLVVFHYCDGGSFLGNASQIAGSPDGAHVYMRGAEIVSSSMEYLMAHTSLNNSEHVILAGYSAGGIGVLVHADQLRATFFPSVNSFNVLVDAAMFVDVPNINGQHTMAEIFEHVYYFHSLNASTVLQECTSTQAADEEWKCLLPATFHRFVSSPVFFSNSLFDTWQRPAMLKILCKAEACPDQDLDVVHNTRDAITELGQDIVLALKNGVYLTPCPGHGIVQDAHMFREVYNDSTAQATFTSWMQNTGVRDNVIPVNVSLLQAVNEC